MGRTGICGRWPGWRASQQAEDGLGARLVGLGLVLTRAGGVPVVSYAYAGHRPALTQFATVIEKLSGGYRELFAAGTNPDTGVGEVSVVFDAGQNSAANFAYLASTGLR